MKKKHVLMISLLSLGLVIVLGLSLGLGLGLGLKQSHQPVLKNQVAPQPENKKPSVKPQPVLSDLAVLKQFWTKTFKDKVNVQLSGFESFYAYKYFFLENKNYQATNPLLINPNHNNYHLLDKNFDLQLITHLYQSLFAHTSFQFANPQQSSWILNTLIENTQINYDEAIFNLANGSIDNLSITFQNNQLNLSTMINLNGLKNLANLHNLNTNQTYYWIQTPFVFENQTPFLASSVLNATAQFLLNQIPLGFSQSFILNPNYKKALKTALERLRQNPNIQQNVVFEYEYYNGANLTNLKYGATLTKAELNEKNYQQWFSKTLKFQKKEVKKSIMHTFFNMLDNITFYTNDWNLYQFKYVNHEWITTLIKTPKEITYQNFFNLLEQTKFINGYQYLYDYYLTSLSGGINNDFYFQLKLNHLPYLFLNYHVNQDSFQFNKDVPYNSHYIPKFHLNLDDLWKNKPNKIYSANLILYNNKKLNH